MGGGGGVIERFLGILALEKGKKNYHIWSKHASLGAHTSDTIF